MLGVLLSDCSLEPFRFARQTRLFHEAAQWLPPRSFALSPLPTFPLLSPLPAFVFDGQEWKEELCEIQLWWDRLSGLPNPLFHQQRLRALEQAGQLVLSNPSALTMLCWDKWQTFELCRRYRIPTPPTFLLTETSSLEVSAPCWLKPRRGGEGRGVERWARWEPALRERALELGRAQPEQWLLQEELLWREGTPGDELRIWLQRNRGGGWEMTAAWKAAPKNQQANLSRGGAYVGMESVVWDSELGELCRRFLKALEKELSAQEWGLCCEFVLDWLPVAEGWALLEANSKPGRSLDRLGTEEAREARHRLVTSPVLYLHQWLKEQGRGGC